MCDRNEVIAALKIGVNHQVCKDRSFRYDGMSQEYYILDLMRDALELLKAQEVVPHRNYKYLSDYWCACGWHLGKAGIYNYCPQCGKKVKWDA